MAHLIDKDALLTEIERRRIDWSYGSSIEAKYKREECVDILSFIDTLEVKEVDLEKEYEKYYEQERYIQTFKLAKHFFELGLKAQKGEEV